MIRMTDQPARFRFSRTDYHRMGQAGIIPPDARVELLDGEIIEMSPIGPRHGSLVDRLTAFFAQRVSGRAICRVQGPVTLGERSEPEPDLLLLENREDYYTSGHPGPGDVLLLIEVADTSVDLDLGAKLRAYAQAGIPEYWVFDLTRRVLIVHREPSGERYASVRELDRSATLAPAALADLELELGNLLSD